MNSGYSAILAISFAVLASMPARGEEPLPVIGSFRNTYYYSVLESKYAGVAVDNTILDLQDGLIAQVSTAFKKAVNIEGTGRLQDGRVINYAGKKNGEIRYHVTQHPYGHGVGDCALIPFHTIAVDPKKIPLGAVVQIDESVGMVLPDGSRHDGTWRVEDIGSAIQEDRIDIFVGEGDQGSVLEKAGITNLKALTVRLLTPPQTPNCTHVTPGR